MTPILSTCVFAVFYSYCWLENGQFYSTIRESESTMNVYIDGELIGRVIKGIWKENL